MEDVTQVKINELWTIFRRQLSELLTNTQLVRKAYLSRSLDFLYLYAYYCVSTYIFELLCTRVAYYRIPLHVTQLVVTAGVLAPGETSCCEYLRIEF